MRISPINQNYSYKTSFKGCFSSESLPVAFKNKKLCSYLIHESAFFRDLDLLEFTINHLKKLKKPVLNIVSGACSEGFELLSAKMLAENAGLKVNCIGFDLGENAIQKAKSFNYSILLPKKESGYADMPGFSDSFLVFKDIKNMSEKEKKLKRIFDEHFVINIFNIYKTNDFLISQKTNVRLKKEQQENVKFILGNLLEMDTFIEPNTVDALFFKNSLYHLTYGETDMIPTHELKNLLNRVAKQISKALSKNGIFILGNLPRDHEFIVGNETYEALEKQGLKPIFNKYIWIKE